MFNRKGFSVVVGAVLVMIIATLMYSSYQAFGIPTFCKNVEKRHFTQLETDVLNLVLACRDLITSGNPRTVYIRLGDVYPAVPFFTTPNGFAGSITTYPAFIEIDNIDVISITSLNQQNPYTNISITGSNLWVSPLYNYLNAPDIYVEYGVIAIGKQGKYVPLFGKFIDNNTIFIPLFYGNLSYGGLITYKITLYPMSAGGSGVYITNYTANNITIKIKSRLPVSFWREVVPSWVSVTNQSDYIVFSLPAGRTYKLIMGVASFQPCDRLPPDYLYRVSPTSQSSPAGLVVQARDILNNPTPNVEVTFSTDYSYITLETIDDAGNIISGSTITVRTNDEGYASVTAISHGGVGIVVASLTDRSSLQPYEVPFIVS